MKFWKSTLVGQKYFDECEVMICNMKSFWMIAEVHTTVNIKVVWDGSQEAGLEFV